MTAAAAARARAVFGYYLIPDARRYPIHGIGTLGVRRRPRAAAAMP
eukprot:SAG31_NODE_708_length_12684_cov_8.500199_5_plen_46_part_00